MFQDNGTVRLRVAVRYRYIPTRMINRPASLDTLVATNLHADILSDLAAALAGSLGIAPTGNIAPERRFIDPKT